MFSSAPALWEYIWFRHVLKYSLDKLMSGDFPLSPHKIFKYTRCFWNLSTLSKMANDIHDVFFSAFWAKVQSVYVSNIRKRVRCSENGGISLLKYFGIYRISHGLYKSRYAACHALFFLCLEKEHGWSKLQKHIFADLCLRTAAFLRSNI